VGEGRKRRRENKKRENGGGYNKGMAKKVRRLVKRKEGGLLTKRG